MVTLPIRNLGSSGVLTDINPYNLPVTGFTSAVNVRFDEGKVMRAPVFRTVKGSLGYKPRAAFGIVPDNGFDTIITVSDSWVIKEYINGVMVNKSGSITGLSDPRPYTISQLADVVYINRPDRVPAYRLPAGTTFANLPNWVSNWRCEALRPYGDFLFALNMTEGSTNYANRVRFSDIVTGNSYPSSWDETDLTKSAGFNDLVQMQTRIVDGLELGNNFIIYSLTEVFTVEFTGGALLFNFRKLFGDEGVINQNCITEAEGKHFVFGNNDIYMHDGTTKQSIVDERVRRFVFSGMNKSKADRCFVQHNKVLNEIYFCYVSGDSLAGFPNTDRCNRAAVFNYVNNTWSFYDLPNVSAGTTANVNSIETYSTATQSYNTVGGSYYDQEDSYERHTLLVGEIDTNTGITQERIYALDLSDTGALSYDIELEAVKPPIIERIGLDLDEIKQPLRGYKVITKLLPQISTINTDNTTVIFEFGASDIPNSTPTYTQTATFDVAAHYKMDSRASGRYLSYKMYLSPSDLKDFEFSGFDLEVVMTGRI